MNYFTAAVLSELIGRHIEYIPRSPCSIYYFIVGVFNVLLYARHVECIILWSAC